MNNNDQALRVGQAAKLLNCSKHTITQCIDTGEIVGWKLPPPSKHRRVLLSTIIAYAKKHGIPLNLKGEVGL